jgi:signal peptidase I
VTVKTEALGNSRHPVVEDRRYSSDRRNFDELTVPAGKYFLMGDNRDNSSDSRVYGFVPEDQIVGRSSWVAVSVDPERSYRPRWGRFFKSMP